MNEDESATQHIRQPGHAKARWLLQPLEVHKSMSTIVCDTACQELIRWSVSIVVPAAAGLIGVAIGAWLTSRRERSQRRLDNLEKQLTHFYSPMLGLRNEIRMHGELRVRIQGAANSTWNKLCAEARSVSTEALTTFSLTRGAEFKSIIDYDNEKLHKELLPAYHVMAQLFRENLWLADPVTCTHYESLIEFVEIWDRWEAKAMPAELLKELGHTEAKLTEFYEHLQQKHDSLRQKLKDGIA